MTIRKCDNEKKIEEALLLAWKVFLEYDASCYTSEGVEEFRKSIHTPSFSEALTIYAAYREENMVGMIATRNNGVHIALFFVDGNCHRQGIGRALFEEVKKRNRFGFLTVNASPYAVPVYHKFGFRETGAEQTVNGMRFTPMIHSFPRTNEVTQ